MNRSGLIGSALALTLALTFTLSAIGQALRGLIVYGHCGTVAGYLAAAFFDRASGVSVIVLRNLSGGPFDVPGLALRGLETLDASRRASKPGTLKAAIQGDTNVFMADCVEEIH